MLRKANSLHALDSHVGSRVKSRRAEIGMSQSKLADAIGVTFQQVQKYERGKNRIGSSRLQQIADALDVSPSYFFAGLPEHQPLDAHAQSTAVIKNFVTSTDGTALIAAFCKISRSDIRRHIVRLVESLAGPVI